MWDACSTPLWKLNWCGYQNCIKKGLLSTKPPHLDNVIYVYTIFTELAHWADSVIESRCPSVCPWIKKENTTAFFHSVLTPIVKKI